MTPLSFIIQYQHSKYIVPLHEANYVLSWIPSHNDLFQIQNLLCLFSSLPNNCNWFYHFPKSLLVPREKFHSTVSDSVILLSLGKNTFSSSTTLHCCSFSNFSNSNYITELELWIQNRNSMPFFSSFTFQQKKTLSKFLEKIFALLNCICDFNWLNL